MDRLPHLTLAALFALAGTACDGGSTASAPVGRRVDAVPAAPKAPVDLDDFCEVRPDPATAPAFDWPELDGAAAARAPGWTWVNVWATWCAPCIEELPRILGWPERLAAAGTKVEIQLLSVDDSAGKVAAFRKSHDWMPASMRTTDPNALTPWLAAHNLDMPAVLPLHLFVDPAGRIRCARSGSLSADGYDAVEALAKP